MNIETVNELIASMESAGTENIVSIYVLNTELSGV